MKKAIVVLSAVAGGEAGLEVNAALSTPLLNTVLTKVGLAGKIPPLAQRVIVNVMVIGHVVAGVSLGAAAGSWIGKKIG